jgi:hypothetical protein
MYSPNVNRACKIFRFGVSWVYIILQYPSPGAGWVPTLHGLVIGFQEICRSARLGVGAVHGVLRQTRHHVNDVPRGGEALNLSEPINRICFHHTEVYNPFPQMSSPNSKFPGSVFLGFT